MLVTCCHHLFIVGINVEFCEATVVLHHLVYIYILFFIMSVFYLLSLLLPIQVTSVKVIVFII